MFKIIKSLVKYSLLYSTLAVKENINIKYLKVIFLMAQNSGYRLKKKQVHLAGMI